MKNLTDLPQQHLTKKSILDYTKDELNGIDRYQDEMHGFIDNDYESDDFYFYGEE